MSKRHALPPPVAHHRKLLLSLLIFGQLFSSAVQAETSSSGFGVSNLLGNSDPSLAKKVSQGTEAVARSIVARSTSGQMNAEVSRLLDDPRRLAMARAAALAAARQQMAQQQGAPGLAAQVVNINGAPPPSGSAPAMAVSYPREAAPQNKTVANGPDELREVLQRVHAVLQAPPAKSSPAPGQLAQDLQASEVRVGANPDVNIARITKPQYNAQIPSPALTTIPSEWEEPEVNALLSGTGRKAKASRSDLSVYTRGSNAQAPATGRPTGSTRLLDTLLSAPSDSNQKYWKPKKASGPESMNEGVHWKNRTAGGSTPGEHSRGEAVSSERFLRVARYAPAGLSDAEASHAKVRIIDVFAGEE